MADREQVESARTWMTAYAEGDVERFLSTMTPDWQVHEGDGSVSTREDLAQSRPRTARRSPRRR